MIREWDVIKQSSPRPVCLLKGSWGPVDRRPVVPFPVSSFSKNDLQQASLGDTWTACYKIFSNNFAYKTCTWLSDHRGQDNCPGYICKQSFVKPDEHKHLCGWLKAFSLTNSIYWLFHRNCTLAFNRANARKTIACVNLKCIEKLCFRTKRKIRCWLGGNHMSWT